MKITIVAGARPNFVKIAPILKAIESDNSEQIKYRLVHTGQHYDDKMSHSFFDQLEIPKPDINLNCGGGSQAQQTAAIMIAFEKDLEENPADMVLVVGDVTSTMACSIVAKKMNTKVIHVEAGIRSNDITMPEEINRMVTDCLSDYFFTTTQEASNNLLKLGFSKDSIFFVGNVMIDTLLSKKNDFVKPSFYDDICTSRYIVLTLHRPANVDNLILLGEIINEIILNSNGIPVIFPIHPRTKSKFQELNINDPNLHVIDPLSYLEFNYLVANSFLVITDSGGITEETTVLGIPCITLRDNTERPETVQIGTNELIGTNPKALKPALEKLFKNEWKKGGIPALWDGKTSNRIVEILKKLEN